MDDDAGAHGLQLYSRLRHELGDRLLGRLDVDLDTHQDMFDDGPALADEKDVRVADAAPDQIDLPWCLDDDIGDFRIGDDDVTHRLRQFHQIGFAERNPNDTGFGRIGRQT